MTFPAAVRATVAPATIDKVGRLFNGGPGDVNNELLQNARRVGATRVDIEILDLAGHPTLIVRDDGRGIDDPRMLLTLGQPDWSETTYASENPAGMGVFSMAGLRVEYRSWPASAGQGWRIVIDPDAWGGKRLLGRDAVRRDALQLARVQLRGEDAGFPGRALDRVEDHIRWLVPERRTLLIASTAARQWPSSRTVTPPLEARRRSSGRCSTMRALASRRTRRALWDPGGLPGTGARPDGARARAKPTREGEGRLIGQLPIVGSNPRKVCHG